MTDNDFKRFTLLGAKAERLAAIRKQRGEEVPRLTDAEADQLATLRDQFHRENEKTTPVTPPDHGILRHLFGCW